MTKILYIFKISFMLSLISYHVRNTLFEYGYTFSDTGKLVTLRYYLLLFIEDSVLTV